MINSAILEGAVKDTAPSNEGLCNATFVVVTEHQSVGTSEIKVRAFGNLAEAVKKFCVQGRKVRVTGGLMQERWEDLDGTSRSEVMLFAEHIDFKPL